jgi:hypothetical protein
VWIGGVGIEPTFQGACRHLQCLLPGGRFQRLKIQPLHRLSA